MHMDGWILKTWYHLTICLLSLDPAIDVKCEWKVGNRS